MQHKSTKAINEKWEDEPEIEEEKERERGKIMFGDQFNKAVK